MDILDNLLSEEKNFHSLMENLLGWSQSNALTKNIPRFLIKSFNRDSKRLELDHVADNDITIKTSLKLKKIVFLRLG